MTINNTQDIQRVEYEAAKADYLRTYKGETLDDMAMVLYVAYLRRKSDAAYWHKMAVACAVAAGVMAAIVLGKLV